MSGDAHDHDVRTEKLDIEPRSVSRVVAGLIAVIVGALLVLLPFLNLLEELVASGEPVERPLVFDAAREPPAPRLQRYPTRDIEALRAEEDAILGSYAWVDESQGIVRLPIERALALAAERGLPELPAAAPGPPPAGAP